ncbi:hypothetical protein CFN78_22605 [Amycolatopsis antarctica]|uniref:Uncharacterized protein n=1 Tax=Amycolatopsis antarctica TaxID=1854586 RepID=A0A263D077_9PSEU|nr:hypothetical protein [Amycolatopsis antarctica]OZM70946.1 hypothetical protein CFN78_22605 [Amycolatopsis antarctica]
MTDQSAMNAARKHSLLRRIAIAGLVAGAAVAAFAGGVAAGRANPPATVAQAAPAAPSTVTRTLPNSTVTLPNQTVTAPAAPPRTVTETVTAQPRATAEAARAPAANGSRSEFSDGTYRVGEDIDAGSYRSDGPTPGGAGMCYWARLADDSGIDIIANDLTEGASRFTAKKGEYVQISGCSFRKG